MQIEKKQTDAVRITSFIGTATSNIFRTGKDANILILTKW